MGKLTRLARRIFRPVAMFGVVGIVSLSMIGAQPAYAADVLQKHRDAKAFEAIIKANYKTIQPVANVALAAASFSPVGMGIRLAQLGFLAFSTSDIWMPWFAGTFGQGEANADTPAPAGAAYIDPNAKLTNSIVSPYNANRRDITIKVSPQDTGIDHSLQVVARLQCRGNADGTGWNYDRTVTGTMTYKGGSSQPTEFPFYAPCTNGYMIGGVAGAPNGDPQLNGIGVQNTPGPSNVVRWGSMLKAGEGFDPYSADTKVKVRSECIAPDGTISSVEAESSGDYLRMPSCGAAGKGHGTGKTSIVGLAPGTTTEKPLWDSPRAPSDPATPLCDAMRPGSGCTLAVELDGKECQSGNVECENWQEVNERDPNKGTDNSRLKCRLGPYTLPLSQCGSLAKAFLPGGTTWAGIEPDGSPSPGGSPSTAPSGNPIAAPAPSVTAPGVGTVPGSPGAPSASEPDQQAAQCWPSGWGMLNPLEWVYKPVVCAAKALFEPKKDLQARVNGMSGQFANKVPVSWFGVTGTGVSGGGCPTSWVVEFQGKSHSLICGTQADTIIQNFRPVLGAMLVIALIWPLIRSLFYAAIPVFKVNPS